MTSGVSKDGSPLFPLMDYDAYREMSREDAESVIAFIRTLPSVARDVPPTQLNFPFNLLVRTMPSPAPPLREKGPDPADRLAYGKYLTTIATCVTCHTGWNAAAGGGMALPAASSSRRGRATCSIGQHHARPGNRYRPLDEEQFVARSRSSRRDEASWR